MPPRRPPKPLLSHVPTYESLHPEQQQAVPLRRREHAHLQGQHFSALEQRFHDILAQEGFSERGQEAIVDATVTFFFGYNRPSPHDASRLTQPMDHPPELFADCAKDLIAQLSNPRSLQAEGDQRMEADSLWSAFEHAYRDTLGHAPSSLDLGRIVERIAPRLAHEINDRLKPNQWDIPSLKQLGCSPENDYRFQQEPLRQRGLKAINHWAAEAEHHPVHRLLNSSACLHPEWATVVDDAAQYHILNRAPAKTRLAELRPHSLDARLIALLEWQKNNNIRFGTLTHYDDARFRKQAAHCFTDPAEMTAAEQVAHAITMFSFNYDVPTEPREHDPRAMVNKALELVMDFRHAGNKELDALPQRYKVPNKYSTYKSFKRAYLKEFNTDPPENVIDEVKSALMKRITHEVEEARCQKSNHASLNDMPEEDRNALDYFAWGKEQIAEARSYILPSLAKCLKDCADAHHSPQETAKRIAELMLSDAMINREHQYVRPIIHYRPHEAPIITGGNPYDQRMMALTTACEDLTTPDFWKSLIYAMDHGLSGGQTLEKDTFTLIRDALAQQIEELSRQQLEHGFVANAKPMPRHWNGKPPLREPQEDRFSALNKAYEQLCGLTLDQVHNPPPVKHGRNARNAEERLDDERPSPHDVSDSQLDGMIQQAAHQATNGHQL